VWRVSKKTKVSSQTQIGARKGRTGQACNSSGFRKEGNRGGKGQGRSGGSPRLERGERRSLAIRKQGKESGGKERALAETWGSEKALAYTERRGKAGLLPNEGQKKAKRLYALGATEVEGRVLQEEATREVGTLVLWKTGKEKFGDIA